MLNFQEINRLNEANLVLRHFVDLSAKLLPFLDELIRKNELSDIEELSKSKIMSVFESYQFDTKTSEMLINSNILELIKKTYTKIAQTNQRSDRRHHIRTLR